MKKIRFSVNAKVFLGILAILVSIGIVGYKVFSITNSKSAIYEESLSVYEFTCGIKELKADLAGIPTLVYNYNLSEGKNGGNEYSKEVNGMNTHLDGLTVFSKGSEKMSAVVVDLEEIIKDFPTELDKIKTNKVSKTDDDENKESEEKVFIGKDVLAQAKSADEFLSNIEESNKEDLGAMHVQAEAKKSELLWWIVFGTVLCLSMSLVTAGIVVVSITNPLKKVTGVIDDISKGNLATQISKKTLNTNDEVGDLARAFDRTMVSLKLAMKKNKS